MKHPCLDLVFVERNSEVFDILTVKYDGGIYHLKMWKQGTLCKFKSAEALVCFIDQFYLSDVLVNSCKAALVMNDDGLFEKRTSTPRGSTPRRDERYQAMGLISKRRVCIADDAKDAIAGLLMIQANMIVGD